MLMLVKTKRLQDQTSETLNRSEQTALGTASGENALFNRISTEVQYKQNNRAFKHK